VLTGSSLGTGNVEVSNHATLELDGGAGTVDEIADSATLTLASGAKIFLNFTGTESVNQLVLGGTVFDYPITFSGVYTQGGAGFASYFAAGSTGSLHVVPEPTTLSFVGLGIGGLLARRRRSRRTVAAIA
jgi:PEP-CTERM motif-containing protein